MKELFNLFFVFARIGAFTFGGGYAMLPMIQKEIVESRKWASDEEIMNYYAVGQCTPGVIAVNTATFIGYKLRRIPGAIFATLGVIFPSVVIITIIAAFLSNFNEYIYVQKTIHKKVKELLYERAKVVIPHILQKVSERINVPYGKLRIEKSSLGNYAAYNYGSQHDITFCAACVQLPEKSLESLCIHELTHNFVLEHNKAFYDKLKELGGEEAYNLDQTRWKEGKWKYIIF